MTARDNNTETERRDEEQPRRGLVPPHIFWPGLVVAILGMSVAAQLTLLTAANSDGGVQIEKDYYARASRFDDVQAKRAAAAQLGLSMEVQVGPAVEGNRTVILVLTDRDGVRVSDTSGVLRVTRPSLAQPVAIAELEGARRGPGEYVFQVPIAQQGLWDFSIDGDISGQSFVLTVRREVDA